MQSSIFLCLSQARIIGRVAAGRASGVKMGGLMDVDCWLVRIEWCPCRLSVCLPLVILPSTMKSRRSFLLAWAHLGGPRKRAIKWLWWCGGSSVCTHGFYCWQWVCLLVLFRHLSAGCAELAQEIPEFPWDGVCISQWSRSIPCWKVELKYLVVIDYLLYWLVVVFHRRRNSSKQVFAKHFSVENVNVLMYMIASDEWYVARERCSGGECKQECLRVTVQ